MCDTHPTEGFPNEAVARVPVEIWQSIYRLLSLNSLRSVSCCSRSHRQIALPLLFRTIKLSEEAIAAFGEGGKLNGLTSSVRNVVFSHPMVRPYTGRYLKMFDDAQFFCSNLHIFPNIRGIRIFYQVRYGRYYWWFPTAILTAVSEYPWFEKLQYLSIQGISLNWDYKEEGLSGGPDPSDEEISREALVFAMGRATSEDDVDFLVTTPFPPALEELTMYYILQTNVDRHLPWNKDTTEYEHPGLTPPVLYRHWTNSLKKLTYRTKDLSVGAGNRPVFPTVTDLHIITDYCISVDPITHAHRFPNVQEFRLETTMFRVSRPDYNHPIRGYGFLAEFPKLRRATVPWRFRSKVEDGCESQEIWRFRSKVDDGCESRGTWKHLDQYGRCTIGPTVLRKVVDGLVAGGFRNNPPRKSYMADLPSVPGEPMAGLEGLEYVDFVMGWSQLYVPNEAGQISYRGEPFDRTITPYEDYEVEICRVRRGGEGWDIRLGSMGEQLIKGEGAKI